MDYIKFEGANKFDLMRELIEFTGSGVLVDDIFNFIIKNKGMLQEDEYVNIIEEPSKFPMGIYNTLILNAKYNVNIRKSLLIFIMLLLDSRITKGVASAVLGISGLSGQSIHKISEQEKCILLETLIGKKRLVDDYKHYKKQCTQKDIKCPYRIEYTCMRSHSESEKILDELISKEIIKRKNGFIQIMF